MAEDNGTHIRLREYIEALMEERFRNVFAILNEREKALGTTAHNLERRLDHLNALREEYTRKEVTFVNRDMHDDALRRLIALEKFQSKMIGMGVMLTIASGIVGALIVTAMRNLLGH